ncbi:hypothetical protein ANCCEY_05268 [Ancylostoma ceylanicum]|uniref:Uncharacterized protein n=1 Tax=Ancylostoma ceylanicum TaxID=53326 RepID=A0A0D6M6W5_9BILA|nr:hypothetical protein ANCCEY_05268 [Ancylostoma ceylanicum]
MCGPPAASASAADVPSAADDDDTPYTGGGARLRKRNELEKLRVPHMLEPTHVTLIVNGENSSAQVMTAATCAGEYLPQPPQVVSATACTSRSSVDEAAQPTLQLEIQAKIIEPPEEVTDKTKMLTKRVSWLSMKSLQENEKSARRTSSPSKGGDSRTANEYDNVTLMYAKHEKIPMKDFGSEIRATMDIDHLLNKAVLLLDLQETSLEEIFAK